MHGNNPSPRERAPTPEEVAAAIRRASELRSELIHSYFADARTVLGRVCRQLLPVAAWLPAAVIHRGVAPKRASRQSLWSILPDSRRWVQSLWSRVL